MSIDFSKNSLDINKNSFPSENICWIVADITKIKFVPKSVDLLIMSDFIQHIMGFNKRIEFVNDALQSLKPNGKFYLSFFNFNLINYLKGDRVGSFSGKKIPYERMNSHEIINRLKNVKINRIIYNGYSYNYYIDKFISNFPFTKYLARYAIIEGEKIK